MKTLQLFILIAFAAYFAGCATVRAKRTRQRPFGLPDCERGAGEAVRAGGIA